MILRGKIWSAHESDVVGLLTRRMDSRNVSAPMSRQRCGKITLQPLVYMDAREKSQVFAPLLHKPLNTGDVEAVIAFYEPQAMLVAQPGQVAEGHAALREALNGFFAMKPTLTLEKHTLVTASDLTLSVVKWTLKGTGPDGQPVQMEGTATDVLRKQADGRWLYVIDNPWGVGVLS